MPHNDYGLEFLSAISDGVQDYRMRRLILLSIVVAVGVSTMGCAAMDGLMELERRKNDWLFGPRAELHPDAAPIAQLPPADSSRS